MTSRAALGAFGTFLAVASTLTHCGSTASGPPTLTALDLAMQGGPAGEFIALSPAFSPTVYDYTVECADGENAFTLSMQASSGADSAVLQPNASASKPSQTVSVTLEPNQALVAVAKDSATTTEYWVRCLPPDFPLPVLVTNADAGAPTPGYYLIGNETPTFAGTAYAPRRPGPV
jgi:hypothetical protein